MNFITRLFSRKKERPSQLSLSPEFLRYSELSQRIQDYSIKVDSMHELKYGQRHGVYIQSAFIKASLESFELDLAAKIQVSQNVPNSTIKPKPHYFPMINELEHSLSILERRATDKVGDLERRAA